MNGLKSTWGCLLAAVLVLLMVTPATADTPKGSDTFDDVPVGHWADEAIGWAVANGITRGLTDTTFGPDGTVTRQQLATLLYRLAGSHGKVVSGDTLMFTSNGPWISEVWAGTLASGVSHMLVGEQQRVGRLDLSPDGSMLAFAEVGPNGPDGTGGNLWVKRLGSDTRELIATQDDSYILSPVWSPDGVKVAYLVREDGSGGSMFQLWVVNSDGTHHRQLARGLWIEAPEWSPDGTKVTYKQEVGTSTEIWVVNSDGSGGQQLTESSVFKDHPAWSPDGTRVVYTGSKTLWSMNPDGTDQSLMVSVDSWVSSPVWSPDSTRVAFRVIYGIDHDELWVVNRDGSDARRLGGEWRYVSLFAWSPDSKRLAVSGSRSEDLISTIRIVDVDTGATTPSGIDVTGVARVWWPTEYAPRGSVFFEDVPTGHWSDLAVGWAVTNDITRGVSAGRFDPKGIVSKGQIVAFVHRLSGLLGGPPDPVAAEGSTMFTDVPLGHWADVPIGWAVAHDIVPGSSPQFGLDDAVSRALIVDALYRLDNILPLSSVGPPPQ